MFVFFDTPGPSTTNLRHVNPLPTTNQNAVGRSRDHRISIVDIVVSDPLFVQGAQYSWADALSWSGPPLRTFDLHRSATRCTVLEVV